MEFRAEARYMRVSPQKARLVLDLIKGQRVEDARNTLLFTKKRVAATVGKLLQSAIDNANFLSTEKNLDVDLDQLYVKNAIANDGPRMKRIRPGADGTRVPLRAAHLASRDRAGGAQPQWPVGRDRSWRRGSQGFRKGAGEIEGEGKKASAKKSSAKKKKAAAK